MKYIIWGAGRRGARVLNVMGSSNIIAFIESDEDRVGKIYCEKKIISFSEYLAQYQEYFIIISMKKYREIVNILKAKKIHQYFVFTDCPSEMVWDKGEFLIEKLHFLNCKENECIGVFGVNLFGILLYEYMMRNGYSNVYLINDKEYEIQEKLEQVDKIYKFASLQHKEDFFDQVLVTNRNFDRVILEYNNCRIDNYYDFSCRVKEYRNLVLEKFKSVHRGKRCFIVATGPSLQLEDLECLKRRKEYCISVNMIYKSFPLVKWRPDYYVMDDPYGVKFYENDLKMLNLSNIFITDACPDFWRDELADNFYKYHSHIAYNENDVPKFSDDIVKCIYSAGTVVYACLQLAIYMGFKEIYLIGADCNYKKDARNPDNHFIENYYNENDNQAVPFALEESLMAYQAARRYAEQFEIKIYNATRGGNLEVFERVNFDSLFSEV